MQFCRNFQLSIIKKIEHRMVDLDMNHAQLCAIAEINEGNWSCMRRLYKPLQLEVLCRVCATLDLKLRLSITPIEGEQTNQEIVI